MTTMHAAVITRFGGPDVFDYRSVPRPEPARGEVLVRVKAVSVNPFDREIRSGIWGDMGYQLPVILGTEMSGTVAAVGDAVSELEVGQDVWGVAYQSLSGGYAEYALSREEALGPKPASLTFAQAATAAMTASTARQIVVDEAELRAGQTIVVIGASGSVGGFVVQLAKHAGARVVAVVRVADGVAHAIELGADEVVDLASTPVGEIAAAGSVDAVYNAVGPAVRRDVLALVRHGGVLVDSQSPPSPEDVRMAAGLGVDDRFVVVQTNTAQLRYLARLFDSGVLKTRVGRTYPLSAIAQAHAAADAGAVKNGKIVLIPEGTEP